MTISKNSWTSSDYFDIQEKLCALEKSKEKGTGYILSKQDGDDGEDLWEITQVKEDIERIFAFLINPDSSRIIQVAYRPSEHTDICQLIGASMFDAVGIDEDGHIAYIDDVGRLDEKKEFWIEGVLSSVAGRALIINTDKEGADISATISLEDLTDAVSFEDKNPLRLFLHTYIKEKGIDLTHCFSYDSAGTFASVQLLNIIDALAANREDEDAVRKQIAEIEFANADPMHFFEFIGRIMAERSSINYFNGQDEDVDASSSSPRFH